MMPPKLRPGTDVFFLIRPMKEGARQLAIKEGYGALVVDKCHLSINGIFVCREGYLYSKLN
jgi:hypothetical protein